MSEATITGGAEWRSVGLVESTRFFTIGPLRNRIRLSIKWTELCDVLTKVVRTGDHTQLKDALAACSAAHESGQLALLIANFGHANLPTGHGHPHADPRNGAAIQLRQSP